MEKIKWPLYTSDEFQNFCNCLLTFEISKKIIPFSAPGRDGGTDGSFNGTYQEHTGIWRFQYKFHLTERKVSYNTFKKDVISELKKVADEDFLLLLTNTELLPQELKVLEKLGKDKINNNGRPLKLIIWEGAKIFTLYLQYPILELWLNSGFKSAQLQEFKDYFGQQLYMEGFDPATQNNPFVAREEQFKSLTAFWADEHQHVAYISGEAGIGKSRLVIEFFKRYIEPDDFWQALVLVNYSVAFDLLAKALSGTKNNVVLIEDAHEYTTQQIEDLKQLVKTKRGNKLKLIFTFRKIEFGDATRLTRDLNSPGLLSIDLTQLSEEDTETLFSEELKNTYLINYIPQLVEISRGRPILIVALLNASQQQKFIPQAKNDQFLRGYVNSYFDSFIRYITAKTNLSHNRVQNFLYLICLLEPVPVQDQRWVEMLCEAEKMEADDARFIFQQLDEQNFFSGKYQQELKPDYYSDIFLAGADVQWLQMKFDQYEDNLPAIIKNLATVEEAGSLFGDQSLLDKVLKAFVSTPDQTWSYEQFKKIIKTIDSLNGYKPQYAVSIVEVYLKVLTDVNHPVHLNVAGVRTAKHYSFYPEYKAVKSILNDLLNHETQYAFVLNTVFRLFDLIPDEGLCSEVYGFGFLDVVYRFSVKRQRFFAANTGQQLKSSRPEIAKFILNCYKSLLKLEFNSSSADRSGMTIKIHHFYIPDQESTRMLRATIIKNLSDFYFITEGADTKILILDILLDIPREIRSVGRDKNNAYKTEADTNAVLDFVDQVASTLPVELHRKVLNKLFWFKHFEIGDKLVDRVVQIEKKISPQNFTEQLIYLLTMAEVNISDDFNVMLSELRENSRSLVKAYEAEEIAAGLITIYSGPDHLPDYMSEFLEFLFEEYGVHLPVIYNFLWMHGRHVCMQIGSGILRSIYRKDGNDYFYWQKIKELEDEGSIQAFNVIIHIYAQSKESAALNEKDVVLIERIFKKRFSENNHWFAIALPNVYAIDLELAQKMLIELLAVCDQRDASILFLFLFSNYPDYYPQAKELLLEHTIRFEIDSRIRAALKKVILNDGFEPVLKYLKSRVANKVALIEAGKSWSGHEPLPYNEEGTLLHSLSQEQKEDIFKGVIDWFIDSGFTIHTKYTGIHLVEYLKPFKTITPVIALHIRERSLNAGIVQTQFIRLTECIQIFYKKDELLIETLLNLYNAAIAQFGTDKQFASDIYMEAYLALTQVGGKHGKAGEPFPEDVALKALLEKVIPTYNGADELRLLNSALDNVNREIATTEERHRSDW